MTAAQQTVKVGNVTFGNDLPFVLIAGPCQMESRDHAMEMSHAIKEITDDLGIGFIYKTSYDKANRTSLNAPRGVGLAKAMDVDVDALEASLARWNELCLTKNDVDFGRPSGTMMKIQRPPFYAGEVWPVVSNTQGGPEHDAKQRIIDVEDKPIPRLYAAGEMGSAWGHLYMSGGNLAECLVTGQIAGREAAGLEARE